MSLAIRDEVIDELLQGYRTPEDLLGEEGLFKELKKRLLERALGAELTEHLGYEKGDPAGRGSGNSRNGYSSKTVIGDDGAIELAVPRDRDSSFEPQIVAKGQTRIEGFDDRIISLYARGLSVREIQAHLHELYDVAVSPDLISRVTDAVLDEVREWQNRPLDPLYPVIFFDALRVKIRDDGLVRNKAVYVALALNSDGEKEVLGLWIEQTEGAKFWLKVMNELKNRGLNDVLIAVVDGLKGFPEAIATVFPLTTVQTCIIHLIRNSLAFVSWKDRKLIMPDLKAIYRALEGTLKTRSESLKLVSSQFKFGAVDALDLARAKTDVATTNADIANNKRQREEVVNVLAILTGKPASNLTIEYKPLAVEPPSIPTGLPSLLLERRPDIVHAERLLAASNEEIGVAKAAYFPRIALTANGGFESQEMSTLFNWPSTVWAVATNLAQPVFNGGKNKANLDAAKARYEQGLATYRQQVLVAFKDVEDALLDIQFRTEQGKAIAEALESARQVTTLATTRYEKGLVSYLDVIDAQRRQLEVEAQAPLILGERLSATVRLIKALGGGWNNQTGMEAPSSDLHPAPEADKVETKPEAPDLNINNKE